MKLKQQLSNPLLQNSAVYVSYGSRQRTLKKSVSRREESSLSAKFTGLSMPTMLSDLIQAVSEAVSQGNRARDVSTHQAVSVE